MKKIIWSLIVFAFAPLSVLAVDYDIDHYYIDAIIKENGDMDVQELIVMSGSFNGYEVGIEYNTNDLYRASGMDNVYIGAISNPNKVISFETMNLNFEPFTKVLTANEGDKLKYTESNSTTKNNYRMYYKTNRGTTAFLFKYTLKDVAIMHNDCIELYWNFFSEEFRDDVKDLNIRINLPKNIKKENIHWWFHGNLAGNSSIHENDKNMYILADLSKLDAYTPIDFRLLLPKEFGNATLINKKTNSNVKDKIIAEEDEIVRKDLETLAKNKKIYNTSVTLTWVFYAFLVGSWIVVYIKYDKERKPKFQNEYNREFIDDYNVEVIDYLMNKSITPNAMSASIMNMIYKKNIEYEAIEGSKKDYKFILKSKDNLNATEIKLVDFLFSTIGNDTEFTTKELKSYASSTKTCNRFMNSYTSWQRQVELDGKKENFFETGAGRIKYGLLVFLFALFITGYVAFNNVEYFPAYFCIFASVIFVVYLLLFNKKTEKGIEHYARWKAFKKFLEDFGTFEVKELPEIVLWERYLVYATIFGLADKVEKVMNVKIHELEVENTMNTMIYFHPHFDIAPVINSSINSAYHGAQTTINREIANSSGGTFGGHGGGFSSGGGFGGGGRSGGGF